MIIPVLIIAIFLRFFNLGTTPAGIFVDEASIGYNAYSIMMTGKDEYGKSFPVLIRSFGDYKAPVYTYLLIPIYKIWGMNIASTRSISAASGVLTILFLYFLVKLITKNKSLAILSSLVLAISPWHILLSRGAFEANLALMFTVIGLWSFYKFIRGNKIFFAIFTITTALAITAYHSERLILPLLYLCLGWYYRNKIFNTRNTTWLIVGFILGFIILLPTLLISRTPAFLARAQTVNVLGTKTQDLWGFVKDSGILNNRLLLSFREWLSLYTAYFSPKYLFGSVNSIPRDVYPNLGPLYVWELPFLIIGVIKLIKIKTSESKILLTLLLILSPMPASLVREPFGTIRALTMIIPLSILIASAIELFINRWRLGIIVATALVLFGIGKVSISAFQLNDLYRYQYWDYGTDQVVKEISKYPDKEIQVDGWRAEIYSQLLFFLKYDPTKYQADNMMDDINTYYNNGATSAIKHIGRITVKTINWNEDLFTNKLLVGSNVIIGDDLIKRYCLTKVFTIRAPDNTTIFIGARTNPQAIKQYNKLATQLVSFPKDCWSFIQQQK